MSAKVRIVLVLCILAAAGAGGLGGWWLAGRTAGPGSEPDGAGAAAADAADRADAGSGSGPPATAKPDLYRELSGRELYARLPFRASGDNASVELPALPPAGTFRYAVAGNADGPPERRALAGSYRLDDDAVTLAGVTADDREPPGELRLAAEGGILRLHGGEDLDPDLRADLREAGRQLWFLRDHWPAGHLSPGDAVTCGAEGFLALVPPRGEDGLVLAGSDGFATEEGAPTAYPGEAGALNEMVYAPAGDGHLVTRVQAYHAADGGFGIRRLELRW